MGRVQAGFRPAEGARENPDDALRSVQREVLERLTGFRWLLNTRVPRGRVVHHPSGYSTPGRGLDTSVPTYIIHPSELPNVLARVTGARR